MSFKEPIPALSNVMDTNEHASSMACVVHTKDVAIGFNLSGYRGLELRGPGAVAHMSLHQKTTMSKSHPTKEADEKGTPIKCTGGRSVRSELATDTNGAGKPRQRRFGEGAYMGDLESGQQPFCNFISRVQKGHKTRNSALSIYVLRL
jgi:hypothetical protein